MALSKEKKAELIKVIIDLLGPGDEADILIDIINRDM